LVAGLWNRKYGLKWVERMRCRIVQGAFPDFGNGLKGWLGQKGRNKKIIEKGFFRIYFREKNNLKVAR
jgi:hypothetical protein